MSLTKIFRKSSVGLAKEFWVLLKECSSVPLLAVRIDSDQALNFITEEKESQIEGGNYYRTTSQSPQNTLTSIPYVILFSFLFFLFFVNLIHVYKKLHSFSRSVNLLLSSLMLPLNTFFPSLCTTFFFLFFVCESACLIEVACISTGAKFLLGHELLIHDYTTKQLSHKYQ